MKRITNRFKLLALLALFLNAGMIYSQCTANFSCSVGPNGIVTFTSNSTPTGTTGVNTWIFGNGVTTSTASPFATTTYTANGTYTVVLFYSTGTCSASVGQLVTVTTVATPTTCNLSANFASFPSTNGTFYFNNTSTGTNGSTTYYWNFGDGSPGSSSANPVHTYAAAGTYTVVFHADSFSPTVCSDSIAVPIVVNNICSGTITPSFTYSVGANGLVNFTSTSAGTGTNTIYYYWNFGNGSTASYTNVTTASTTYTSNGTYNAMLILYAPSCGTVQVWDSVFVTTTTTTPCNLNAHFTWTQGSGNTVNFNNTSTGTIPATTYAWSFGDGNSSTSASPTHTYSSTGVYVITLTATSIYTNNPNPCVSYMTTSISVTSSTPCALNASFSYSASGNTVFFFNTSTGTGPSSNYQWHFGDGGTGSGTYVSHTYTSNGTFNAWLQVTNTVTPNCADSANHTVIIGTTNTCVANASFVMFPSGTPHSYYAIPSTSAGVASATWYWGDGSTSNTMFTSHTYSAAGLYNICLKIVLNCGDSATYCMWDTISRASGNTSIIQVNVVTAEQVATAIKNINKTELSYVISPNPANDGNFNLSINGLTATRAKVSVYNSVGKAVYETESEVLNGALLKNIQLNDASGGVYFIRVSDDIKSYTKKLIINK